MPNWVYNHLTIEGNPEIVKKLVEQVGKPFTLAQENHNMGDISSSGFPTKIMQVEYNKPVFAFYNIVNYKDMGITDEEYACQPVHSKLDVNNPDWWADTERLRLQDKSWYSWNVTNWGCKWDVAVSDEEKYPDTYTEGIVEVNDKQAMISYNFNTPWGIPDEALVNLSSQYPDLDITLSYEEETGWGGERIYVAGDVVDQSEYGWKCRNCEHEEEEMPYCEECDYDICPSCGWGEPDEPCEQHKEMQNA
mgnify:FL=1